MQIGQGDEVGFVEGRDLEESMANLLDDNGTGEGHFLTIVALELRAQLAVRLSWKAQALPARHAGHSICSMQSQVDDGCF